MESEWVVRNKFKGERIKVKGAWGWVLGEMEHKVLFGEMEHKVLFQRTGID